MKGRIRLLELSFSILLTVSLASCGGGGQGTGSGQSPPSAFNGTFSGQVSTFQDNVCITDNITISLSTHSPMSGTFYTKGGDIGTISGNVVDNTVIFTGTVTGICPSSVSGQLTLINNNTLSINMTGSNCNGQFTSTGSANEIECIPLAGTWSASENGSITCVYNSGESETEPISGAASIVIEQNACGVSYVPPSINAPRNGNIEGNEIGFSGLFAIPLVEGVIFSQNIITFQGPIIDQNNFKLDGSGIATGTYEGIGFTCTGKSSATFSRCYDVAVAVLHGSFWPLPNGGFVDDEPLGWIKDQTMQFDPKRVIARGFGASVDQLLNVADWLDTLNKNCNNRPRVLLIGHSLGGNAVRLSNFQNVCSRITIDPINGLYIPPLNQRNLEFAPLVTGRFTNILAATDDNWGLLGYRITGIDNEIIEPNTNHSTIINRVFEKGVAISELEGCLE